MLIYHFKELRYIGIYQGFTVLIFTLLNNLSHMIMKYGGSPVFCLDKGRGIIIYFMTVLFVQY